MTFWQVPSHSDSGISDNPTATNSRAAQNQSRAAMWHLLPLFANSGGSLVVANSVELVTRAIPASRKFSLIAISEIAGCSRRAADSHATWPLAQTMPHHPIHSILYTGVRPRRDHNSRSRGSLLEDDLHGGAEKQRLQELASPRGRISESLRASV